MSAPNPANATKMAGQAKNFMIRTPALGASIGITAMAPDSADMTCAARFPS